MIVIGVMTGRRRVDRIEEMEEGRHRGVVGYQSDYGSRLSNLVRDISKMDVADQEFLRTLLTVGGGGQTPAGSSTEQLSHIPRPGDPRFLQTPRTLYDHDSASGWDTERQTSALGMGAQGFSRHVKGLTTVQRLLHPREVQLGLLFLGWGVQIFLRQGPGPIILQRLLRISQFQHSLTMQLPFPLS